MCGTTLQINVTILAILKVTENLIRCCCPLLVKLRKRLEMKNGFIAAIYAETAAAPISNPSRV
jgi:hypothetical protein